MNDFVQLLTVSVEAKRLANIAMENLGNLSEQERNCRGFWLSIGANSGSALLEELQILFGHLDDLAMAISQNPNSDIFSDRKNAVDGTVCKLSQLGETLDNNCFPKNDLETLLEGVTKVVGKFEGHYRSAADDKR